MSEENNASNGNGQAKGAELHEVVNLGGMYENWFLDYASYVILERAVPEIADGLKPVQRRILHALRDKDDGRFIKGSGMPVRIPVVEMIEIGACGGPMYWRDRMFLDYRLVVLPLADDGRNPDRLLLAASGISTGSI